MDAGVAFCLADGVANGPNEGVADGPDDGVAVLFIHCIVNLFILTVS